MPLSPQQWVQLNLQQQGLHQQRRGKAATLAMIEQLGYVQIDSINVVERAHHHVLQSRIANYQPQWLDELLAQRKVFEYWSHAAAYLPMQDFRFSLFRKQQLQQGKKHWFAPDHQMMQLVRARITAEGPLKASDFTATAAKNGTWWDWQPAKQALEQLFMQGELMVVRREKFQKVFDLTERVLPTDLDLRVPSNAEFVAYLIDRYLQSHGCGSAAQISYLRAGLKPEVQQQLLERQAGGELGSFMQQGQRYFYPQNLPELAPVSRKVSLLNPFDNLVIQRQRLQHWFDFDYQIEVYVPAEKRKIGYYSLPILYRQQLIGQMDVKAVRAEKVLLVQHLVFNEGTRLTDGLRQAMTQALAEYAAFNGCEQWQLVRAAPALISWLSSDGDNSNITKS
jgi:uncharacterized protein YcaQ